MSSDPKHELHGDDTFVPRAAQNRLPKRPGEFTPHSPTAVRFTPENDVMSLPGLLHLPLRLAGASSAVVTI